MAGKKPKPINYRGLSYLSESSLLDAFSRSTGTKEKTLEQRAATLRRGKGSQLEETD